MKYKSQTVGAIFDYKKWEIKRECKYMYTHPKHVPNEIEKFIYISLMSEKKILALMVSIELNIKIQNKTKTKFLQFHKIMYVPSTSLCESFTSHSSTPASNTGSFFSSPITP